MKFHLYSCNKAIFLSKILRWYHNSKLEVENSFAYSLEGEYKDEWKWCIVNNFTIHQSSLSNDKTFDISQAWFFEYYEIF